MTNTEKPRSPFHVPPVMLALVIINYLMWAGLFAVLLLQQGHGEFIHLPVLCLFGLPLIIMLTFVARVFLYVMYSFFWYFHGCLATIGIFLSGFALYAALTRDTSPIDLNNLPVKLDQLPPLNPLTGGLLILAFIGVWSLVRMIRPRKATAAGA